MSKKNIDYSFQEDDHHFDVWFPDSGVCKVVVTNNEKVTDVFFCDLFAGKEGIIKEYNERNREGIRD